MVELSWLRIRLMILGKESTAPSWRALAAIGAVHTALVLWAAWAWINGPFRGEGVIDGAEILRLASEGSAGPFETKSPLYPELLGALLKITGEVPWTVALLGLSISLSLLVGIALFAFRLGGPRASLVAAGLYAVSGSVLAFAVQPLPTIFAAALITWGALLLEQPGPTRGRGLTMLGGVLLAASCFARASLLFAAVALIAWAARRRPVVLLGVLGGALLLGLFFGGHSWPDGGGLNLRLANGGERSGICDLRPGPRYERLRWDSVASQSPDEPLDDLDRRQYELLAGELGADPVGAARTVLRKALLFGHPTELVASADFRHGLRRMPIAPLLLWSFALVAPLAVVGLFRCRQRTNALLLAVLGILLANVFFAAASRYRFPALPFLCVAAGYALATPWPKRDAAVLAGTLVLCWPNWSGVRLVLPGDGLVQEGHLHLERDRTSEAGSRALEAAVELGDDPRAAYLLALCHQRRWQAAGDPADLDRSLRGYQLALEREPDFPQAAENRVALLLQANRIAEARAEALALLERIPRAALLQLNLSSILENEGAAAEARRHAALGHQGMALRALSQNDLPEARLHAERARALGIEDRRLDAAR